jgi:hypothetical protein
VVVSATPKIIALAEVDGSPISGSTLFGEEAIIEKNTPWDAAPPRILDRVRSEIFHRYYSYRNQQTYVHYIKKFILFSD